VTLEQLRIFIAVAEREHVTQAARTLNLTQSAASAAIAALEARYGIRLFDRVGRGIVLTQTGRIFLAEAKAVVARAHAAEQVIDDLAGLRRGALTIAASQTIANYWLPQRLPSFQTTHPGVALDVRIANTEVVAQLVQDGAADIGFVEGVVDDPALNIRKIEGDTLIVVVGVRHPWVKLRKVEPAMLTSTEWILREPGSGTRSMFDAAIRRHGLKLADLTIRLELPSNEAVRGAVESGLCATAISNLVVARALASKTLHHVPLTLPARPFFILRHNERHAGGAGAALLEAFGVPDTTR
jgi:DNA-binding transcriptional LysR family regulator